MKNSLFDNKFSPRWEAQWKSDQNVCSQREQTYQEPALLSFSLLLLCWSPHTQHSEQSWWKASKNCPRWVLLDHKGQEYLLFRIHPETNNSEKLLLLLSVVSAFAHVLLDAFTTSPSLIKYRPNWGQWKKAERILSLGRRSSLTG